MYSDFDSAILFASRLLLGGAFVVAGLRNIQNRVVLTSLMKARGVPQAAAVLRLGIVLQLAAGAVLITGFWTAIAAAALLLFLISATPMFHNFWDHEGADRATRVNGFISNVALAGGLLAAIGQA